ncbi:MAG: RNA polymerase sigma factor [Bacteroidota bacterium]
MSTYFTKDERQLVKQCLRRDEKAQRILYQKYVDAVFHTALRMSGKAADAEDITQDCFIRVFQQLHAFKGESSLGAWIKRIAVNLCLNHLRRQKNALKMVYMADSHHDLIEETSEENQSLDVKKIHDAIQTLPEGSRIVLSLYLLEGYRHQEIADILGITVSTSKSQYHRAKALLKKKLKKRPQRLGLL